jgi:ketosteroid isomerase-like protein
MNRRISLILPALAMVLIFHAAKAHSGGSATTPGGANQAAIMEVLTQQQNAWNQGDIATFMQGYWKSAELTFAGANGITRGYESVLARYQRSYPDLATMGKLDFSDLEFHALGDNAGLVLGKWHLARQAGDVGGVFSLVFQRFPDGWKIVHDHTSQVAPEHP